MSENTNDGGGAFPVTYEGFSPHEGMTLRDYFAAKALNSVLNGSWPDMHLSPKSGLTPIENCTAFAYEIADAMLKARAK